VYILFNDPTITLLSNVGLLFLTTLFYQSRFKQKFTAISIVIVLGVIAELLLAYAVILFTDLSIDVIEQSNIYTLLMIILSRIVFFIGVIAAAKIIKRREQQRSPFGSWLAILTTPVCSIIILYHVFSVNIENHDVVRLIFIVVSVLVMNIVAFFLYDYLENSFAVKAKNQILAEQVGYYTEHSKAQIEYAEAVKALKHDLKNHIIALKSFLDEDKNDEAKTHINNLLKQADDSKIVNTNNFTIDAIINYKLNLAETHSIGCRTSLKIPPNLTIASEDVCVILGNLLDNAIEASLKIEKGKRFININMTYDKGNLYILVSNAYDGEPLSFKAEKPLTTKNNTREHGIGLNSVSMVLKKYNSDLDISLDLEKSVFTADFVLYGIKSR
jgi:sensor histidine kinase YesM